MIEAVALQERYSTSREHESCVAALIQVKGKGAEHKRKSGVERGQSFHSLVARMKYFPERQFLVMTDMLITAFPKILYRTAYHKLGILSLYFSDHKIKMLAVNKKTIFIRYSLQTVVIFQSARCYANFRCYGKRCE